MRTGGRKQIVDGKEFALSAEIMLIGQLQVNIEIARQHISTVHLHTIDWISSSIGQSGVFYCIIFHPIGKSTCRQGQEVAGVEFQTGIHAIPHVSSRIVCSPFIVIPVVGVGIDIVGCFCLMPFLKCHTEIRCDGEFACLCCKKEIAIVWIATISKCPVRTDSTRQSFHLALSVHHDIEDAHQSFRIIFSSRFGDDLDAFHHTCRQSFEKFLGIVGKRLVRSAILEYFEITRTLDFDRTISIDGNKRHFLEHLYQRIGLCLRVGSHIIADAIVFSLHHLSLCLNGQFAQTHIFIDISSVGGYCSRVALRLHYRA